MKSKLDELIEDLSFWKDENMVEKVSLARQFFEAVDENYKYLHNSGMLEKWERLRKVLEG